MGRTVSDCGRLATESSIFNAEQVRAECSKSRAVRASILNRRMNQDLGGVATVGSSPLLRANPLMHRSSFANMKVGISGRRPTIRTRRVTVDDGNANRLTRVTWKMEQPAPSVDPILVIESVNGRLNDLLWINRSGRRPVISSKRDWIWMRDQRSALFPNVQREASHRFVRDRSGP